jgi:hypothetical protein
LTWDFLSPSNPSRLWSSSNQFSVGVVRVQEMNGDEKSHRYPGAGQPLSF